MTQSKDKKTDFDNFKPISKDDNNLFKRKCPCCGKYKVIHRNSHNFYKFCDECREKTNGR